MHQYPNRSWQPEPPWARLALPLLAIVTAALLLTDLAAILSSLLWGHGVPTLRGGWVGGALRLLIGAGDPRAAWQAAGSAPPRCLLLLILTLLAGGTALAALSLWHRWQGRREERSSQPTWRKRRGFLGPEQANQHFGAAATRREAARLHPSLSADELRRRPVQELAIALGRCGHSFVYALVEHAVAVVAGMRQGKTTGVAARQALTHRGPLVYTTTKPADLEYFFLPPEGSPGKTVLFNPDSLSGLPTATFDPVLGCEDPDTARLRSEAILARQRARGQDRGLDWALLAEKLLKYLLHAAALEQLAGRESGRAGMARVVEWAASADLAGAARVLEQQSRDARHWAELLREMARSAPETFYSIKINLHEALVCWEDPGLLRRMTPVPGVTEAIDPRALVRNGDRLLVVARPSGHSVPLVTSLVSAVVEAARQEARRALAGGGRLDPPLLLLLDEVAKVCPLPQLPELVTDCASQGIVLLYFLQSLEDGEVAWGTTRFRGMWSATNCHVVMGQVSSSPTLRDLSDLSPTVRVEEKRDSHNQRGERLDPVVRWERALTTDELQAIPHHTAVVFYGARPMHLEMPHVGSRASELRARAQASRAAWLRWAAEHQGLAP
jgi:type IV secretory pathway TraG/TraD family ATPase VirD4